MVVIGFGNECFVFIYSYIFPLSGEILLPYALKVFSSRTSIDGFRVFCTSQGVYIITLLLTLHCKFRYYRFVFTWAINDAICICFIFGIILVEVSSLRCSFYVFFVC